MKRCNVSRIKSLLKSEKGYFQSFEWSYLVLILLIIVLVVLPDLINIGRFAMNGSNAASYAITRTAEQGRMDQTLADDVIMELTDRGITDCYHTTSDDIVCFELYGTAEQKGYNSGDPKVEAHVNIKYRPRILAILPNIRLGNAISMEDGIVKMSFHKVDMATPYIRE